MSSSETIIKVFQSIIEKRKNDAINILNTEYRYEKYDYDKRKMTEYDKLKIFISDGFIDRYSGKRLVFPNVLRIISFELKEHFPFHKNWKMSECHIAYWELMPTYDHVVPIARGGKDIPDNIVTTSQIMNSAKDNFLVEEIGFKLYDRGDIRTWDGLIGLYLDYVNNNNEVLSDSYLKKWHNALLKCISEGVY